jgi:porphobilinogen synthase
VRETALSPAQLIKPLFLVPGSGVRKEVSSLPGQYQVSVDVAVEEAGRAKELGIGATLLFCIPEYKDERGTSASLPHGIVQQATEALKRAHPGFVVVTDLCFCEYTSHGHCGVLKDGELLNDETLELLKEQAASHARAGADMIAPSGMIDGMVGAIREGLDEMGFSGLPIMSYAVKFASAFYGPFRDAVDSKPSHGDRKSYQMDPANIREALLEAELDIEEGADLIMVKPALAYLDVIRAVSERSPVPVAAYNVSGEYAMVKAAGRNGWIDERRVMLESLLAIRRAGADIIITYFAEEYAELYRKGATEL